MVEVTLLTDKGIVFGEVERQIIDEWLAELQRTPDITRLGIKATQDGRDTLYMVFPANILLNIRSFRH